MLRAIPIVAENRIREAMTRGEFDDLEGAGKPLTGLDDHYRPDWWIESKLRRERLTAEESRFLMERLREGLRVARKP